MDKDKDKLMRSDQTTQVQETVFDLSKIISIC